MMGPLETNFALADVFAALFRQKAKIAAFFVVVMGVVAAATLLSSSRFLSESKLLVRLGRENVTLDGTATMGQGLAMAVPASREDEINSVVEMLNSRIFAERLVDVFGASAMLGRPVDAVRRHATAPANDDPTVSNAADRDRARAVWAARAAGVGGRPGVQLAGLPIGLDALASNGERWWARLSPFDDIGPREEAVGYVRRHLSASAQRKSNVITVSYEARSPEFAQSVVQKFVEIFLENHIRMSRAAGSRDFFESQTAETYARLQRAEATLRDIKDATGVTSIADQRRIMVERLGGLEDQVLTTEAALAVAVSEVQAIVARLATLPEMLVTERASGMANEAADGMRQQLYLLQLREQELLSKYTDAMPAVQEIRRQIAEAESILAREQADRTQVTSGRNPAYEALYLALLTAQSDVAAQQAKLTASRQQLVEARLGLIELNDHEVQLAQVQREMDLQDDNYRRYAATLEQVRIDQALETERISNISVVQPATFVEKPVRPRKLFNLGVGFLVACFGSLGLALVVDHLEQPSL